jgi:biopolymer transport protein ExbD
MARRAVFRHPEPLSTMNVTPFIDVLLVLLIMLILTIPMMSHKVPVDLPSGGSVDPPGQQHQLAIDAAGKLFWDGRAIGDAELPGLLIAMQAADDRASLTLNTSAEARYERFNSVLATVKRANVTRLGFVGNERMAI